MLHVLFQQRTEGHDTNTHDWSGSIDLPATPLITPCEFDSCPTGSPAEGNNASNPDFNYVNSFPITSIKYGIETTAPRVLGSVPEFAVTGPNVGGNTEFTVLVSGTVGAATYAASTANIPAIAFSGASGDQVAWNATVPAYTQIYSDLATNITNLILDSGAPYLPADTYLNVNFPSAGDGTSCTNAGQFQFVLSRILPAVPLATPNDVKQCGSKRLPKESSIVGTSGCYVSISVGKASSKVDSDAGNQQIVRDKLAKYLSCLPSS